MSLFAQDQPDALWIVSVSEDIAPPPEVYDQKYHYCSKYGHMLTLAVYRKHALEGNHSAVRRPIRCIIIIRITPSNPQLLTAYPATDRTSTSTTSNPVLVFESFHLLRWTFLQKNHAIFIHFFFNKNRNMFFFNHKIHFFFSQIYLHFFVVIIHFFGYSPVTHQRPTSIRTKNIVSSSSLFSTRSAGCPHHRHCVS